MYKIMTKLHTSKENVFGFHMVTNDNEEKVEYQVKTKEEAAETALDLLGRVGYEDLRIVDDQSYYLDLIYGKKPIPEENLYTLTIVGPSVLHAELKYDEPNVISYSMGEGNSIGEVINTSAVLKVEGIKENETVSTRISFDIPVQSFHLVINDKEYKTGLPKWISYEEENKNTGILSFHGITRDYIIEVIIDDDTFIEPTGPEASNGAVTLKFDESIIEINKTINIKDTEYQYNSTGETEFTINSLENGTYTIEIWADGYSTATYEAIIGEGNINSFIVKLIKTNSESTDEVFKI